MNASRSSTGSPSPTLAQAPVGLLTSRKAPVPLLGVHVEVEIRDLAVRQTITQHYRNTEDQPIEAVYVFPVDETAAICGFNAVINDVLVVGKVMEREVAFEAYDDALRDGHGAYLLDQERPDVFTASIGNLPPGAEVLIQVITVGLIGTEGEHLAFVLPTTVAPRYAPEVDRKGVGRPPAEALNPPRDWQVPYGLEVHIQLDMPSAIRRLESPTHPLRMVLDGAHGEISLGEQVSELDRDLVIYIGLADPLKPRLTIERHPAGKYALMAIFAPDALLAGDQPALTKEIVFLLDRSGSMGGPSIESARRALHLFLHSLPEGCAFNIVGYGSTYDPLFPVSQPYHQQSLERATQAVDLMQADLGGTLVLRALQFVFSLPSPPNTEREVILLTDGQVSNTEAVLDLVRAHSAAIRLSSIGLGASASQHLVNGLARAGNGWAEYIAPNERPEAKVVRQLGRALAPKLPPLRMDWGGLKVEQAPWELRPVSAGEWLSVFALADEIQPAEISLKGPASKGARGQTMATLLLDPSDAREGLSINALAARELVRDLEEGTSRLHTAGGSRQTDRRGPVAQRSRQRLIELGTTYGLLTSATSLVAVEVRETPVVGDIRLRRIPVALARDWGGLRQAEESRLDGPSIREDIAERSAPRGPMWLEMPIVDKSCEVSLRHPDPEAPHEQARRMDPDEVVIRQLTMWQRADGSWSLDENILHLVGRYVGDQAVSRVTSLGASLLSGDLGMATTGTAVALALLQLLAEHKKHEWGLMAEKGRAWLKDHGLPHPDGRDWVDVVREALSRSE